ncbi:LacI family DNA-binding transcriptional regulator [Bifidobacterium callitrichidarum]|uniref:LacI family transcriptional regulator n=1 Tax=Bifidobacterium callitrichidarum TaxID=2052941 RepID=A0A2U2NCY1_9BIFI|nr:LacI family DNA-binding transcriptional regulator [Bifidobacterium callitrichidarum]PWG66995.1 LacI family transcriptional regulator [Bifidobacterium callitrichidarum]
MRMRKITMKDVALQTGVSIKTVSNVINGNDSQVSAVTKQRITEAVKQLGYRVNSSAKSLKTGKTGIIGLAVPNFGQPFFGYFVDMLSSSAHQRGCAIVVATYGDFNGGIEEFAASAYKLNADGWIMFAADPLSAESPLFQQNYPMVLTGDYSAHGLCDMVTMPNVEAARYVTEWLIGRGLTKIGFVGAPRQFLHDAADVKEIDPYYCEACAMKAFEGNAALRLQGYIQAHRRHGLEPDWRHVIGVDSLAGSSGVKAGFELAQCVDLPEALVCVDDALALGVISSLTKMHIDIPNDVQIIGIDNLPDGEFSIPPLSTIDSHVDQYADMAVDALIRRIDGDDSAPSIFTSGFRLLERESTIE